MKKIETENYTYNISYGYVIGGIGLVIASESLYYSYKQNKREVRTLETIKSYNTFISYRV